MSTRQATAHDGLWSFVEAVRPEMGRSLRQYMPPAPGHMDESFNEALRYALFPGGKRLRPVLTLLGAELVGGRYRAVLAAAAVEYLHASSLIFDDLPRMDDAAERRGRVYLPAEDLARFGVGEDELERGEVSERFCALMEFEIARARAFYREAEKGIPLLDHDARLTVLLAARLYARILDEIGRARRDLFTRRAHLSAAAKLLAVPRIWREARRL